MLEEADNPRKQFLYKACMHSGGISFRIILVDKLMVALIYLNNFYLFFQTVVNDPEIPIKHFKQGNNTTRFMFSKQYLDNSTENEFEMS